jgi:hypothetical protein
MHDMSLLLEKAKATKKKKEEERQKEKDKREKERDKREKEKTRREKEREEQEKKRAEKAARIAEEQSKKKKAEDGSEHEHVISPPPSLSPLAIVPADTSQKSGIVRSDAVVVTAKPVAVKPMPLLKKEDAVSIVECVRVRDEFLQLKNLLGARLNRTSIIEQHTKTLKGKESREAFSELTTTYIEDLQAIADILVANKSSPGFSTLQSVISEQTMKEVRELGSYVKVFSPPVSVTVARDSSDSVALGELPPVDHSVPSFPSGLAHSASSPKLSPVEALRQDIERMKKDAIVLEAAIKEGDAAVLALQEQQRKKEVEVAALKERQTKLAEELAAAEKRLPELEEAARVEAEASRKRIEEERAKVVAEHKQKAEVDAVEDLGEDVDTGDEVETGEDQQAMLALFQQFMKAQALAKKKAAAAKKKAAASDHDVPRHSGSTPPL